MGSLLSSFTAHLFVANQKLVLPLLVAFAWNPLAPLRAADPSADEVKRFGSLGPLSTDDQAAALKELGRTRPYVDLSRVGKLLIITGSGETNTHIQIIEGLVDRLIELGKPFDYMVYPNRDHGLREGRGSEVHVRMLILRYLLENFPSGPSAIAASLK
jgi:hypothetical protein